MTPQVKKNSLIGKGMHIKIKDEIQYQCQIVDVLENHVVVQYFEWGMGEPTTQGLIALIELTDTKKYLIHNSVKDMVSYYERHAK